MRVAILGTRGIPASYSGFETSVQETAVRFVRAGIETIVYCKRPEGVEAPAEYRGVTLRYLPSVSTKHLETITRTALSVISVVFSHVDAVIVYGLGNALFLPFLSLFSLPAIAVVDGADWERAKWGVFAKWFLKSSRVLAVRFSRFYVVDNELLSIGPAGFDLGRTFDRWPMSDAAWARFCRGYGSSAPAQPEAVGFWKIYAALLGARVRYERSPQRLDAVLRRLQRFAAGDGLG